MTRTLTALATLLALAPLARAQDMPLSQILIEGEGWKKVEGEGPVAAVVIRAIPIIVGDGAPLHYRLEFSNGRTFEVEDFPGEHPQKDRSRVVNPVPRDAPMAALLTPDGATLYVTGKAQRNIWAYQVGKDGRATSRGRYCPLRTRQGQDAIAVSSLATDTAGRIYAATEIGVQVFDPTGRLCGVLTPAAPGMPRHMAFEGDQLTMWIGDAKYTRKLNTRGVSGRPRSETPATEK